jgi:ethanolamine utilization protein EutQ
VKLITEGMLQEMAAVSKEIVLEPGSRLTPSARDYATMMGLTIIQEYDRYITRENRRFSSKQEEPQAGAEGLDINQLTQKIVDRLQQPVCSNPRPRHIAGDTVEIPPFNSGQPGLKMGLANVVTSREANLAAGFMTFKQSELPWKMTYDEVNYVIEGDYVLKVDGQVFRAKPGDVLYIPKGSQAVFSSPTFAKVFYVTYPANWDELK